MTDINDIYPLSLTQGNGYKTQESSCWETFESYEGLAFPKKWKSKDLAFNSFTQDQMGIVTKLNHEI